VLLFSGLIARQQIKNAAGMRVRKYPRQNTGDTEINSTFSSFTAYKVSIPARPSHMTACAGREV
jgi:hypothetical protein